MRLPSHAQSILNFQTSNATPSLAGPPSRGRRPECSLRWQSSFPARASFTALTIVTPFGAAWLSLPRRGARRAAISQLLLAKSSLQYAPSLPHGTLTAMMIARTPLGQVRGMQPLARPRDAVPSPTRRPLYGRGDQSVPWRRWQLGRRAVRKSLDDERTHHDADLIIDTKIQK